MNCSVCGSPLLFDRIVFKCSCGAYVHSYCADKHIVESHRPEMEEGYADLNGEFHPKHQPAPAALAEAEAAELSPSAEGEEEVPEEDLTPGEEVMDEAVDEAGGEESGEDD